jgi:heat shock protein HtpX
MTDDVDPIEDRAGLAAKSPLPTYLRWRDATRAWLTSHTNQIALVVPTTLYLGLTLFIAIGWSGVAMSALLIALVASVGQKSSADLMLSLYCAEPISPGQGLALRSAMATLCDRAGLTDAPALAVVPSLTIGTFGVGAAPRTAILVTEGMLRRHSLDDAVALIAHEIAHIRNGDLPIFALSDIITRLAQGLYYLGITLLALKTLAWFSGYSLIQPWAILLLLLAPTASSQLQLWQSRQREFDADQVAAHLLGDQLILAHTVAKLAPDQGHPLDDIRLPVPQRRVPTPSPLRSHPDGHLRAQRLRDLKPTNRHAPIRVPDEPMVSLVGFGPIEMRPRNRWPGLWF